MKPITERSDFQVEQQAFFADQQLLSCCHTLGVDYCGLCETASDALKEARAELERRTREGISIIDDTDDIPTMADLEPFGKEWEIEQAERRGGMW